MKWNIQTKLTKTNLQERLAQIQETLFQNRHLTTKSEQKSFLEPAKPDKSLIDELPDLNKDQLFQAVDLIKTTISQNKPIIVYGDYDCDGLCATTILWETLNKMGAQVLPFIPHRVQHGYGLSSAGLKAALSLFPDQKPLIITVDNGISAGEIVDSYRKDGGNIIITDHHHIPTNPPKPNFLVHTTAICGAGVSWILASALSDKPVPTELVAIATICDQLPLIGANRQLVIHGLNELKLTTRPGLKALTYLAGIENTNQIEAYHIGFIIGPRLNAAGRLGDAMIALRLLCTTSETKAWALAQELHDANTQRQDLTSQATLSAITHFKQMEKLPKILTLASDQYHEGVIGLIAARLTDQFARPAIVISSGQQTSKGSARSIGGIHITQILQQTSSYLVDFGGHEQAAGLSILTSNITAFQSALESVSENIDENLLAKQLNIEIALEPSDINNDLMRLLKSFMPFGTGNPQPIFMAKFKVLDTRRVGKTQNHLQCTLISGSQTYPGIAFNVSDQPHKDQDIEVAFCLEENNFRGNTKLQLRILDWKVV